MNPCPLLLVFFQSDEMLPVITYYTKINMLSTNLKIGQIIKVTTKKLYSQIAYCIEKLYSNF